MNSRNRTASGGDRGRKRQAKTETGRAIVALRAATVKTAGRLAPVTRFADARARRAAALLEREGLPDQAAEARCWGDRGSRGAA